MVHFGGVLQKKEEHGFHNIPHGLGFQVSPIVGLSSDEAENVVLACSGPSLWVVWLLQEDYVCPVIGTSRWGALMSGGGGCQSPRHLGVQDSNAS